MARFYPRSLAGMRTSFLLFALSRQKRMAPSKSGSFVAKLRLRIGFGPCTRLAALKARFGVALRRMLGTIDEHRCDQRQQCGNDDVEGELVPTFAMLRWNFPLVCADWPLTVGQNLIFLGHVRSSVKITALFIEQVARKFRCPAPERRRKMGETRKPFRMERVLSLCSIG